MPAMQNRRVSYPRHQRFCGYAVVQAIPRWITWDGLPGPEMLPMEVAVGRVRSTCVVGVMKERNRAQVARADTQYRTWIYGEEHVWFSMLEMFFRVRL